MPCAVDYRYEDQQELRDLTRVACDLVHVLRTSCQWRDLAPETKEWIRRHDAEDEANREAEERAARLCSDRQRVLESMSPEHRRILGLG